ncbi:endonuclease/exonuclease/phosphatase family protein [Pseudolysinimonas sp.]|uniref:endonuclease/exonuclease/phosphatase family protein n=1 Tax=Pseudolysinimonas sp. TaxID=2680009 RepID=UPI003F80EAD2
MFGRVVGAIAVVAIAVALLLIAWPQLLGLQQQPVIAQVVSLRGIAVCVAALLLVLLLIAAATSRGARRFAGALAVVVVAFGGLQLAVLSTRGVDTAPLPAKALGELTVLSWNTLGDAPGSETIAQLAQAQQADVVVLAETSVATAQEVRDQLDAAGMPMQLLHLSYDQVSKARTTDLLISTKLGAYRDASGGRTTDTIPTVYAVPADGTGPSFLATHTVAPVPGEMSAWRQGLRWVADHCVGNAIAAGDFNSTLDHWDGLGANGGQLGSCRDAAKLTGSAAVGTWPTRLPTLLGAPIDHVLATAQWKVVAFRVIDTQDGAGSDHRPVVARLAPTG